MGVMEIAAGMCGIFSGMKALVRRVYVGACVLFFLLPAAVCAQSDPNRVLWDITYDGGLSALERGEVESSLMRTVSRSSERHFVGDTILLRKLELEGLNFPDCFSDGVPCASGNFFVLDVYNVDVYVRAKFSKRGGEWGIDLKLYRRLSGAALEISNSGPSLPELLQRVLGSIFEMESEIEVTTSQSEVEVYVNGRLVGKAPLSMRIGAGAQAVEFRKSGYVSQRWTFEAEKGKLYEREVELDPEVTHLTVLSGAAGAQVYVDGEAFGAVNAAHEILPGDHHIEVRCDRYRSYEQDYRVYAGNPQTIQVALLPEGQSPYTVRRRNLGRYRFSGFVGYHFMHQKLSMLDASVLLGGKRYRPAVSDWGDAGYHGVTFGLNYEDDYWGIGIFKLDLGWSRVRDSALLWNSFGDAVVDGGTAMLVGFYPAQLKGHYTFWVMQAEAVFGLGLGYSRVGVDTEFGDRTLEQLAFSINFNVSLKYYLSEESYLSLGYELQYDVLDGESARHGLSLAVGLQFPVWMRAVSAPGEIADSLSEDGQEGADAEPLILEGE